jgi:hypothetical protein
MALFIDISPLRCAVLLRVWISLSVTTTPLSYFTYRTVGNVKAGKMTSRRKKVERAAPFAAFFNSPFDNPVDLKNNPAGKKLAQF